MSDYDAILLEDINHKLDAILEGQQAMGGVPRQIEDIDTRLGNVESDVKAIKAVVTHHDRHINKLEKAVA
ncbi:MAG: hypothetical protein WA843_00815 [Candidatus Saccharimonadales bacterium]